MRKYRYRGSRGVTRRSLIEARRHLHKVGNLRYIKGYRYRGAYGVLYEGVLVVGTKGSCRLGGFCWGYNGEGPRGLITFLQWVFVQREHAEHIAQTFRGDNEGEDWRIEYDRNGQYTFKQHGVVMTSRGRVLVCN